MDFKKPSSIKSRRSRSRSPKRRPSSNTSTSSSRNTRLGSTPLLFKGTPGIKIGDRTPTRETPRRDDPLKDFGPEYRALE